MNIISQILLFTIAFQCFFFAVFLISRSGKKKASNTFLAILLVALGAHMGINLAVELSLMSDTKFLIGLSALYGPALYLHIKSLQRLNFKLSSELLPHFILSPIVVIASALLPEQYSPFLKIAVLFQVYMYLIFTLLSVFKFQKIIKFTNSNTNSINLNWASNIIVCFLIISVADLVNSVFNFFNPASSYWVYLALLASLFGFVNIMFYKALIQPKLFQGLTNEDEIVYQDSVEKYIGSDLTDDEIRDYKEQIEKYILDNKPYLEPKLTIGQLAELIGISPRIVSQVINTSYETNFSDYINDLRLEEAKSLLINDKEKTVLEILYEVGFNSKSTFYDNFKLKTGLSPKEFRKKYLFNPDS